MLYLIPAPLHRQGLRLAHAVRLRWWRIRRPSLAGVRVLALDPEGRVLLIRHSYGSGSWMMPGGGMARGESPIDAGARELVEETACRLAAPRALAISDEDLRGAANRVHIVCGLTADTPRPDGREVIEAAFFAPHALPHPLAQGLAEPLAEWITAATAADRQD